MPDLTPDDVARREFRTGFRGYETSEVRAFLSEIAEGLASLVQERDRLLAQTSDVPAADLASEIEAVTSEVGAVLQAAHEAAESMRERASADATRWRSEAVAEAQTERSRAAQDAEALRSDAWTMSEQLLNQCQTEAERVVEEAKKEALRVLGEAEREAHRMQAASRREAEDVVRAARMEAERLSATAKARHDEMIDDAMKQSEAAQERTLALEKRRQELLGELESVRATLTQVEDALDQRRERLGLSPSTEAIGKVVTKDMPPQPSRSGEETPETWTPGETVRVVRPSRPGEAPEAEITAQPPQPEVKILSGRQFARIKAGLDPDEGEEEDEGLLDQREEDSTTVKVVGAGPSSESERPSESAAASEEPESAAEEADLYEEIVAGHHEPAVVEEAEEEPDEPEPEPDEPEPEPDREVEPEPPLVVEADAVESLTVEPPAEDAAVEAEPEPVVEPETAIEEEAVEAAGPEEESGPEPSVEVAAMPEPAPEVDRLESEEVVEPEPEPELEPVAEEPVAPDDEENQQQLFGDVSGLFDRLRVDRPGAEPSAPAEQVPEEVESMVTRRLTASMVDPFEVRDRLLLPIGNRALRNLKRQLTEAQNVALEEIRLDESGWEPSADAIRDRVRADLVVLFAESFGAGHTAAEEMLGGRISRPGTPREEVAEDFVEHLTHELTQVVHEGRAAGQGARQLGASLSRVFRGWRTDQAERRVRDLSLLAYHQGLARSLELGEVTELAWKVAGRGCATCRAAAEERPEGKLPPAHPGCECTVGP